MHGLMSDRPMLLMDILRHGADVHRDARIISCTSNGPDHSYSYEDALIRASKLGNALLDAGYGMGCVVGTIAWNNFRHFEIYYGTAGIGAICHTINPRLSTAQISDLIDHADDKVLFVEADLIGLVAPLMTRIGFPHVVVLGEASKSEFPPGVSWCSYEEFISPSSELSSWPSFDERTASSLCYTSGTTGKPKGVLYSHRSSVLHAMSVCRTDTWAVSGDDIVCSFAPMFHVNAWGLPFATPLCGADLVLPGPHFSAPGIYQMLEEQRVTLAFAVPTLWHDVLSYMEKARLRFSTLQRVVVSGSSISKEMMSTFEDQFGIEVLHVWGMTESSPMGMVSRLSRRMKQLPRDVQNELKLRQGRPVFGTEICLMSLQDNERQPEGAAGELAMRGLWTASSYFKGDSLSVEPFFGDDWFRTGDVAARDPFGFFRILDRRKDAIKSGGEWISSLELEEAARGSNQVVNVAAVGVPHSKWGERPVLAVVAREPSTFDKGELLATIGRAVQKWAVPDRIVLFDSLPMTSTGKLNKEEIRKMVQTVDVVS
jgi:acyl-CoA synthetase (AMP-forming)/AMP-acid ligase II